MLLSTALAEQGMKARCSPGFAAATVWQTFLDRVIRKRMSRFQLNRGMDTATFVTPRARSCKVSIWCIYTRLQIGSMFQLAGDTASRISVSLLCTTCAPHRRLFPLSRCDRFSELCAPCPILKTPLNRILAKDEQRRKLQAYRSRRVQFVANSQWLADLADRSAIVRACGCSRVIPPELIPSVQATEKAQCVRSLDPA